LSIGGVIGTFLRYCKNHSEAERDEEKMRAEVAEEKEPFLDIARTIQLLIGETKRK
jgi:hypothetical protein